MEQVIRNVSADWLLSWLAQHGISVELTLGGAETISIPTYLDLLAMASRSLSNPNVGLQLADEIDTGQFGLFARLIENSSNLREAFELNEQYMSAISPGMKAIFRERRRRAEYVYELLDIPPENGRHDVEFTLAATLRVLKSYGGESWHPESVSFQHACAGKNGTYENYFGCPVAFGQKENCLVFKSTLLGKRNPNASPELVRIIRQHIDEQLREAQDLSAQTKHHIANLLGTNACTAGLISRKLFVSERTLNRKLEQRGTSFRLLKQEVIEEIAKLLLKAPDIPITQIALRLGYSEPAAFVHAFKKRTGLAPRDYRKRNT